MVPPLKLLTLLVVMTATQAFAQIPSLDLKLQLMPDGESWGVYVKPKDNITPSTQTITGSAQVTVVMPVGFQWNNLTNHAGNWTQNATAVSPIENPTRVYTSFGLVADVPQIQYISGTETLLFTFSKKTGPCPDTLYLIDNSDDPFNVLPNSFNNNPGNQLSVIDFGVGEFQIYWYSNNYDLSAWKCYQCDLELEIDFNLSQTGCAPATVTATAGGGVPGFAYSYLWNTGSTAPSIQVTQNGWYTVLVKQYAQCQPVVDSLYVTLDYGSSCAYMEGHVSRDDFENCLPDSGETPLKGWLVQAAGANSVSYATTNEDGHYFLPVDPGDYTLTVFPPDPIWEPCENNIPISLPSANESTTVDFMVQRQAGCPALWVDIGTDRLRRCFSDNYYKVHYCNEGTGTATDAYIDITFDPFISPLSSNLVYSSLGNNAYRFPIGNIEPGFCGNFKVRVSVSCDAVLGRTHCTSAHIYPDTSCYQPDPLWSGASLEIEAVCSDSTRFVLSNEGTGTMTVPLEYIVFKDAVMHLYNTGTPLAPGESIEVALPANGSTWRLQAVQEPLHPQSSQPMAVIEGCGVNPGGTFSLGFVNQFAPGDPEKHLDTHCTQNRGSYDPNDKSAVPTGYGDKHYLAQGTAIDYLVRFQNTGTDTAFTVVIRDTISPFLDISTLQPGASSHLYEMEVLGHGIVKFTFPNIMLPDSNVNVEASQGFVQFKISPFDSLPVYTKIENSAAIYFDFNEPIITNTVFHTIEKPLFHTAQNVTLCAGEPFNGFYFRTDTMVVDTFSFTFYDSLVWTNLTVLPSFSETVQATICQGESYPFYGQVLTTPGSYLVNFTAANGCDSTVFLTLNELPSFDNDVFTELEPGMLFNGSPVFSDTILVETLTALNGCDSVVVNHITVLTGTRNWPGDTPSFSVFPNPAGDVFFVKYQPTNPSGMRLHIMDMVGRPMKFVQEPSVLSNGEHLLRIETGDRQSGVYIILFQSELGTWREVVVVNK